MGEQYTELSTILRRVRARWLAMTAMRVWTWGAVAAASVLLAALVAHRLITPEGTGLVILWGVAALAAAGSLLWVVAPLRRAPGDGQVARFIEECCPELEDTLVTAVSERENPARSAMLAAVVGDALRRARTLDLDRIISREAVKRAGMSAAAATVALFILGFFSAGPAGRAARVFALYVFPERFAMHVTPGDVKLRAGQSLEVRAHLPGAAGGVVPTLRFGDGKEWRDVRMTVQADGAFTFAFDAVEQGFTYSISAAAARSRDYRVTVVRPPRVERIDLHYDYPRAFGLKPRLEEDSGDIYGPLGTRVRMSIHADKPITAAALTMADGKRVPLQEGKEGAEGELVIVEDGSYRVALSDADGLTNPGDTEYFIRTLEDRPPDVRVIRPAGDRQVTPIEEVSIEARADDDFGIASFDLVYSVRGAAEKAVPFRVDGSGMTVNGSRTVFLEDLAVEPGDFVTYYARARDVSRGKRATEARSDIFFLEVKPFEEEFVAAQSQAMGGGSGDRSLDDLAEAQKEIIVATWKLDARGRNARGQSQEDIRNVARAQAELQKRAQGAMGQLNRAMMEPRRRRSARPAGPVMPAEPSTTDDPMSKAVAAMGKAVVELEGLKTAGALPHEMTALNELLRAQAEVRKRQVQRQQNAMGGGRGSNRQQQDLSSLFDRELARQQSTNYETPSSSETREEQNDENSALDKIRELARRQDALNRQQQELAKRREQMSEEELRRELEKLTREQSELRRQAEELARQMQQQSGQRSQQQSQQSGRGQQGQQSRNQRAQGGEGQQNEQNSRALREASEEMQSAASDLRRQDPTQASARGTRALDKLRDLEQRMRSAQPDDRRRALGELRLESRQLADAQRQLATERERQASAESQSQGQRTPQGADAARRRAGEQERLADRMQRLEQSIGQLARAAEGASRASGDERKALGDASRELDRQKLSERMRNAARAEREAGAEAAEGGHRPDQRAAAREGQEIAKQLERLAERLGSASGESAEARRLSEQLARNRELREKIGEIDRQLAEMRRSPSSQGQQGQTGQQGGGDGGRGSDAQRGQEQGRPWQEARELVDELRREEGLGAWTPTDTRFNPGLSAPGTEAWKQDFAKWEELKKQMEVALEKAETSLASQLREQESKDRLNAGATQAVPEAYRRLVDKYYQALAAKRNPNRNQNQKP